MLGNKRVRAILGSTILLVMGFFWSTQVLAVDPDMQALVIDNGCSSGYYNPNTNQCEPESMQVSEPSTLALMIIGLAAVAFVGYRRKTRNENTAQ